MNLVIDDAVEVKLANKTDDEKRRELGMSRQSCRSRDSPYDIAGQILLKGDNVSLIQALQ